MAIDLNRWHHTTSTSSLDRCRKKFRSTISTTLFISSSSSSSSSFYMIALSFYLFTIISTQLFIIPIAAAIENDMMRWRCRSVVSLPICIGTDARPI
ncbi:hypothetical protein DERF_006027 [Dermatophagoides farinae]|uniref:Transmembrane protein n=1 Tax=Dermatophagoides farinae TaxID=6954 RepID=A0A922L7R7_DERFA|nr:hypothetical protein DERF_006027 [Dermatophagoides farinae]